MFRTFLFSMVLSLSVHAGAKPAPTVITSFAPQSLSETTNQIKVAFSDKMVALSVNPDANIFDLKCSPQVEGVASWQDEKSWTFDFRTKLYGNKLPGGTRCTVALKPGLKSLAGAAVTGKTSFQFQVDGPNIIAIYPGDTNGTSRETVIEDQVFAIGLDAEVDQASLLKNAYFKVDGIASPIQLRILSEAQKLSLMKAENFPAYKFRKDLPLLFVQGAERFPANKKVSLVWGKGIKSAQSGLSRERQLILPFESRSLLTATFTCNRENANAECSPFSDMQLNFSAEIPADLAKRIRLCGSKPGCADGVYAVVSKGASTVSSVTFPATIKEKQTFKVEIPAGIQDEAGRPLANASSFPLVVKTSDFPPLAKFAADFGIIEANAKPVLLPATLRNLEAKAIGKGVDAVQGQSLKINAANFPSVVKWMKTLDIKGNKARDFKDRDHSVFSATSTEKPSAFNIPVKDKGKNFEVVGIPLTGAGFYVVELQSTVLGRSLLGKNATMYVPTGALVTNMVVHLKWGRASSLFWVTALDSGQPVSGAQVSVYDCNGKAVLSLPTDNSGIAKYNGNLSSLMDGQACTRNKRQTDLYSKYDSGFFVGAQKNGDFTFTHSGWDEGIEAWRFGVYTESDPSSTDSGVIAHSVLDRTLLRAGETVSMKHFIRVPVMSGFKLLADKDRPTQVWVEHSDTQTRYPADLKWDANGTAVSQIVIPKDAKLGLYTVTLVKGDDQNVHYPTATFQVLEFKVPQLKGTISFPTKVQNLVQPGKLDATVSVNYQDGGPAANKNVTFRYTVGKSWGLYYEDYPSMSFGMDRVIEKQSRSQDGQEQSEQTAQVPVRLDSKGSAVVSIPGLSGFDSARDITAQLEFTDSNGESQNITRSVRAYPAAQLVGVSVQDSASSKANISLTAVVVDLKGKPVAGVTPNFELFEETVYTHKTRMVGGFYSSESFTEVKKVPTAFKCDSVTDAKGLINCTIPSRQSGTYIVQAEVRDAAGNASYGSSYTYVSGQRRAWFPSENNDRMDLVAQKKRVQSGEEAVFQVKMPFAQATVLVTVEREGVLESFVTNVSTTNPVIKVPIKEGYAPNVYVSALAVRGRVSGSGLDETATVDLGKPSFKLGVASVNVNWAPHELNVKVATPAGKDTYKPNEFASVNVEITSALTKKPVPNAEFAIAVVDEGLLELAKNHTWDLLTNMMANRDLSVETATAQMQVVGKRHYGLKAKPTGGDGGQAPTRELGETLVYWNARLTTDANGKLSVPPFKMNGSLSKFRVVVVAHSGINLFGKGETSIVTAQDISIIPALAQVARTGDKYASEMTIRNATKVAKTVTVKGKVKLTFADGHVEWRDLKDQVVTLGAQGSAIVSLGDIAIPENVVSVDIYPQAVNQNGQVEDAPHIVQKVLPSVYTRTWMAQLSKIDTEFRPVNLVMPPTALPNQGGVKVSLLSSLADGLDTVQDSLTNYPFQSLESQVSAAAASGDKKAWDLAMRRLPAYLDSEGLVMYYPSSSVSRGSDILTAYVLSVAKYAGLEVPQDLQGKMIEGLTRVIEGKSKGARAGGETANDLFIRRVNAIEVLARYGVAQTVWLTSLPKIAPQQIPTQTLINLVSTYSSLTSAPARQAKLVEYQSAITGRLTLVGTGAKFSNDSLRPFYSLSSVDTDQVRLILVLATNPELATGWKAVLPKLVLGATQMMQRGSWDLTIANAYGVLAMKAFAQLDPQNVTGISKVTLGSIVKSLDWSVAPKGGVVDLGWTGIGSYTVDVTHQGTGSPWAIVSLNAAVPVTQKVENHIQVEKIVSPLKAVYKVGDEVTITLKIKAQTELANVSLVDPIPAGAKILGSGLDNDANNGPVTGGWVWPDSQELASDSYRASYSVVPAETFEVVYKIRLNNAGTFKLPTTRIEAVYMPENFAELPNSEWKVNP